MEVVEPVSAVLYAPGATEDEVVGLLKLAKERLFSVSTTLSDPDPEWGVLTDTVAAAREMDIGVVLISRALVVSTDIATLVDRMKRCESEGVRLVSLEEPFFDSRDGRCLPLLEAALLLERKGHGRLVRDGMTRRKEEGAKFGRAPRCANCSHSVSRKGGGKGHLRTLTGGVGPCFVPGCGCTTYEPWNVRMMGAPPKKGPSMGAY